MKTIAIACGGTGGHVFPGLATAKVLAAKGENPVIILSKRGVEAATVSDWRGPVENVRCPPLQWGAPWRAARSIYTLASATCQSLRLFRKLRPTALLAMGNYTSFGPVIAARLLRIPVVLHEANAIPGSAISFLSRAARTVCVSFDDAKTYFPASVHTVLTGMPIRTELAGRPPLDGYSPRSALLIMGGSQGARAVNRLAVGALKCLKDRGESLPPILHLSGQNEEEETRAGYAAAGISADVRGFLKDMGGAYAASKLCISRSGAAATAELRLCGLPSVLIPLPNVSRDHQTLNAEVLERAGAAKCLPQSGLTPEALADVLTSLWKDDAVLARMRGALKPLATPDAAERLAAELLKF